MNLEKYKQVIHDDFSSDADFMDKTIKGLGLDKNAKILDIGTGMGAMSILLALNGFDVLTGQPEHDPEWEELSEGQHEHCEGQNHHHEYCMSDWRENAMALGVEDRIRFKYLDATKLEFTDKSFDGIFLYDALQHIKDRKLALNECIRLLTQDGLICVIEWNEKSIKETEEKYGFTIDYIDPAQILNRDDAAIKMIKGNKVNAFIIRKN